MTEKTLDIIFHAVSMVMLIGICFTFYSSFYYNIKYIREAKISPHRLHVLYTYSCLLTATSYTIVLLTNLTQSPMGYSLLAGLLLRPTLFLLGCSLLSISKARYRTIKKEVFETNILLNSFKDRE